MLQPEQHQTPANMIVSNNKKEKPILHDPQIIPRVQQVRILVFASLCFYRHIVGFSHLIHAFLFQYLEENVDKTYVDVAVMARELQLRYPEYTRRKTVPFRLLVEQAYKTVLHSYGLDSNPSSDEDDDDLQEIADGANRQNQLGDTLNKLYTARPPRVQAPQLTNDDAPIDISSDDSEEDDKDEAPSPPPARKVATPTENGTTAKVVNQVTKKRRYEEINSGERSGGVRVDKPQSASTLAAASASSRPKKYKKQVTTKQSKVTFDDVGGMDKTLKQLCELLLHLKHPEIYNHIGLPPPRGFLLHGPPGSGKTLLANAIAGQLNIPLLEVPATELVAGVSGESEERIRDVFEQAAALSPCVLFIDEIDAISSNRINAQKDMERRIVAQLLNSLDGLSQTANGSQVLVIGATNRPDALDPALRRVGRFDQEILLGIPDRDARREILKIICRNLKLDDQFDFDELAALTPGYVGADLLALATRAASTAVKRVFKAKESEVPIIPSLDESIIEIQEESPVTKAPVTDNKPVTENPVMEVDEAGKQTSEPIKETSETIVDEEVRAAETVANLVAELADEVAKAKPLLEQMETDEQPADVLMAEKPVEVEQTPAAPEVHSTPASEVVEQKESEKQAQQKEPSAPKIEPQKNSLLSWLNANTPPLSQDELKAFKISFADFKDALKLVQPSAKREGFITVPDVTWDDIGSLSDIREELKLAILAPVKFPDRLKILGLSAPSGVLLCGPPGCGKTLLAKAVANEAGINFISVKGPELLNMYVGESERAVRQCFQRARNSAPCVIFFDEFDSLCPKRSDSSENSAGMRVVNQLLTEMDGVEGRTGVFLMAATNRPDIIDPAVLRPGRFDKILYVGLPTLPDRVDILKAVTKQGTKPPMAKDVDLDEIAKRTEGFTGADLAGLIRQASLFSLKDSIQVMEGDELDLKVHSNHLLEALRETRPSVAPEDKLTYDRLKEKYSKQI